MHCYSAGTHFSPPTAPHSSFQQSKNEVKTVSNVSGNHPREALLAVALVPALAPVLALIPAQGPVPTLVFSINTLTSIN